MRRSGIVLFASLIACAPPSAGETETETDGSTATTQTPSETGTDDWLTESPPEWGLDAGVDWGAGFECDPYAQDCPDQEKCVPVQSSSGEFDDAKCVYVTGEQAPGEPCIHDGPDSNSDDCDASGVCWFVEAGEGVCVPFCAGTPDAETCPDGLVCFSPDFNANLNVCVAACDPLAQDCAAGQACHWTGELFACSPSNDIPANEPCETLPFDCAAGSVCVGAEAFVDSCAGEFCCASYCDVEDPEACAELPGSECVEFWADEPLTPELAALGVCLPQ